MYAERVLRLLAGVILFAKVVNGRLLTDLHIRNAEEKEG
jgi:hypothetical protein